MSALALDASDEPVGAADDWDVPALAMLQTKPLVKLQKLPLLGPA